MRNNYYLESFIKAIIKKGGKEMKKRVLILVIAILTISLLSFGISCKAAVETTEGDATKETGAETTTSEEAQKVKMLVSVPTQASEWWVIYANMVRSTVDAINAEGKYQIELDLIHSDEATNQLDDVGDKMIDKPDIVLLAPIDMDVSVNTVKACTDAGVPVVTMVRLSNSPDVKASIVWDEPKFGSIQAEQINAAFPDGGNLVYLWGPREASYAIDHVEKGLIPTLEEYPEIKLLQMYEDKQDTQDVGLMLVEDALVTYDNIDCIAGTSDDLVLGAIQAAKAAGRFEEITFIGSGTLPQSMCAMQSGDLSFTIMKSQAQGAEYAVNLTLKVFSGEAYEKTNYLDPLPITKDTYETFKDATFGGTIADPAIFDFSDCS